MLRGSKNEPKTELPLPTSSMVGAVAVREIRTRDAVVGFSGREGAIPGFVKGKVLMPKAPRLLCWRKVLRLIGEVMSYLILRISFIRNCSYGLLVFHIFPSWIICHWMAGSTPWQ